MWGGSGDWVKFSPFLNLLKAWFSSGFFIIFWLLSKNPYTSFYIWKLKIKDTDEPTKTRPYFSNFWTLYNDLISSYCLKNYCFVLYFRWKIFDLWGDNGDFENQQKCNQQGFEIFDRFGRSEFYDQNRKFQKKIFLYFCEKFSQISHWLERLSWYEKKYFRKSLET